MFLEQNVIIPFSGKHCQERHYVFQIRRCSDAECCPPSSREWQWLPDPVIDNTGNHYKSLETVLGTVTTEKDRPSSTNQTVAAVAQEQQVINKCRIFLIEITDVQCYMNEKQYFNLNSYFHKAVKMCLTFVQN